MPDVMYQTLKSSSNTKSLSEGKDYKVRRSNKEKMGVHHQKLNRDF